MTDIHVKLKHGERLVVDIGGRCVSIEYEEPSEEFIVDIWSAGRWTDFGEEKES